MKAIIETGGKQYLVEEGSEIYIEKLDIPEKGKVIFDKVLMCDNKYGTPLLQNVTVEAEIVKHGKQKKIVIFKYRPKKSSHTKQGHRQPYTKAIIKKIIVK